MFDLILLHNVNFFFFFLCESDAYHHFNASESTPFYILEGVLHDFLFVESGDTEAQCRLCSNVILRLSFRMHDG